MDNPEVKAPEVFAVNTTHETTCIKVDELESLQINFENAASAGSSTCRTCATDSEFVIPIFDGEGLHNNLADKIHQHLPIQVSRDDSLPLVLCYQCASTLLAWHELHLCCTKADKALRDRATQQTKAGSSAEENKIQEIPKDGSECDSCWVSCEAQSSDDETPLAAIANKHNNTNAYNHFYMALLNFRNHLTTKHTTPTHKYPDLTESSENDDTNFTYDDLTESNMRKDKMAPEMRAELNDVKCTVNGKTYYRCQVCDKRLSAPHTFIFHKRIHSGERPCVCHVCGKQFRVPNTLHRHITETHVAMRTHQCTLCHNTFVNSQNLKHHMRIHTGERPYVCATCGKRFRQSGALHIHAKMHSAHYPFVCVECGAKFRSRGELRRHGLKHTDERPHACPHCAKCFKSKYQLNIHMETHTGTKTHACHMCDIVFVTRRALNRHTKRAHQTHVLYTIAPQY